MADTPDPDRLKELEQRIEAAKKSREPTPPGPNKYDVQSLGWRMVLELVIGIVIGCFIGYGIDVLFGTLPLFLVIFALLGFAAGVRTMMRSADEMKRKARSGQETE